MEDTKLVEALVELVTQEGWRADNGTFKSGYLQALERVIEEKTFWVWIKSHTSYRVSSQASKDALQCNCRNVGTKV